MTTESLDRKEFFDTYTPDVIPLLKSRTYIDYPYLTELEDAEFDIESATMINLSEEMSKREHPFFILFIKQDPESQRYLKIWLTIAEMVKNEHCDMAFCNLQFEKKVNQNFKKLGERKFFSHPFFWARYQRAPFALVYRDGWPQGFYNGGFFPQDLLAFITDRVNNPAASFDKNQKIRPDLISSLRKREMELMNELDDTREREDEYDEKMKLKEMDPREQIIAHAVKFE
jgi:hypothetical protein